MLVWHTKYARQGLYFPVCRIDCMSLEEAAWRAVSGMIVEHQWLRSTEGVDFLHPCKAGEEDDSEFNVKGRCRGDNDQSMGRKWKAKGIEKRDDLILFPHLRLV